MAKKTTNREYNTEPKVVPNPEKLVQLLIDNYGAKGKRRALGSILLEAGYSPASAHNPKIILQTKQVQEGLEPFLESLKKKRDRALVALTEKKLDKEGAKGLAYVLDILTKNHELLSGRPTERTDNLTDEQKQKLDRLLDGAYEEE